MAKDNGEVLQTGQYGKVAESVDPAIGQSDLNGLQDHSMNGDAAIAAPYQDSANTDPSASNKSYEQHSEIMDAVMNLAQAASAQQAGTQESAAHPDPSFDSNGEQSKKRKATSPPSLDAPGSPDHANADVALATDEQALNDILAGSDAQLEVGKNVSNPAPSQDEDINASNEFRIDSADQTGDVTASDLEGGNTTAEQILLARNGRPLNTSKRAAQNRAAQRAFRARRDEYVRQVEDRAKQLEDAQTNALAYRERFEVALETIQNLRADIQALRTTLSSLSDKAPEVVNKALDEIKERPMDDFELNPELPTKAETSEEEAARQQHNLNELSAVAAAAASAAAGSVDNGEQV